MSQVFTEGRHAAAFIISEANGNRSRDNLKIAASQTILAGSVLGKNAAKGLEAASDAKSGGNTGDGTFVLDSTTPVLRRAKVGTYTARFITTTSIRLEGPDGVVLGDTTIGGSAGNSATINEQIKAVVTQGTTPFAAGDGFDVLVTVSDEVGGDPEYGSLNLSATDGREEAAAIAIYDAETGVSETVEIAGITRDCTVNGKCLEWPAGITAVQKDAAISQLAVRGIIVR